ncbi:MAG TPA: methyl-accepting chemotaxis protein [Gemmataceae bacterium]|nr:methyl-accepting chemotaxis protein [Gemmataceae bacterium]
MRLLLEFLSLKNLKIGQKLAVVALPLLLPVCVLSWMALRQSLGDAALAGKELQGAEYARSLRSLLHHVQMHRALASRTLNGAGSTRGDLEATAAELDADASAVDALDQKYGAELHSTEKWRAIRARWSALKAGVLSMTPEASREEHAGLIADVVALTAEVQTTAALRLDSQTDPHLLQEALFYSLPNLSDAGGRLHGLADDTAARARRAEGTPGRTLTPDERTRFAVAAAKASSAADELKRDLDGLFRDAPLQRGRIDAPYQQQQAADQAFHQTLDARILNANEVEPADIAATAARATEADFALADALDSELTELLTARRDEAYRTTTWTLIGVGVGLLLVAGAAFLALRTITRQVADIRDLFARISVGEFGARANVSSNDELGRMAVSLNAMLDNTVVLIQSREERDAIQEAIRKLLRDISGVAEGDLTKNAEVTAAMTGPIAGAFNVMIGQLRRIIGSVKQATQQVSAASRRIHGEADQLVRGTEVQTQRITQTFRSVEEMARSVQNVAASSDQGAEVAGQALASARRGAAAVDDTITGMNRIRERVQGTAQRIRRLGESSQQIGEIVRLIDDIADRTSILALNASIQAAAAGEAGRGFAVVAEEVEQLAERSAAATRKIAGLVRTIQGETSEATAAMEESTREVVEGSRVANQAGQALADIEAVSNKLATLIRSISEASRIQASTGGGVARAMGEISEITQQTAVGARQSADAVSRLARLADDLRESVSAFRLPDPDEPAPIAPSRIAAAGVSNEVAELAHAS